MYVSSRQGYKPPVKSTGRGKKYSHFASLKYCNGAETFYTYDPQRRRLQNLTVNSGGNTIMDNAYTYDAVSNVLSVVNGASVPQSGKAGGQMAHTYTYDALYRLVSATGTYTGADNKTASYTLAMGYGNMHRITSKRQILTQNNVQFNGSLNAGYDLTYIYGTDTGKKFQLANVKDVNYRTEETPSESENVNNNHAYEYDANGNLVYVNTSRTKKDGIADEKTAERKLKWDEENRLLASDDNGFVTNYWYDADGERTVKTSGESDQVYVNSEFAGGRTNTAKFSLYVSPYLVANQGGRYTKHIYIGSQRVVSKIGDFDSYGSDPRRIQYAGSETDGLSVDYKVKYAGQLQVIKDNYATFAVPYNGEDNNDYVDGKGFCCNDGSLEAAQARVMARAMKNNFQEGDSYEKMQFYYHPDHLGSSSYITNLEGEVVQHIEYVPFGEVFVEERNNIWNTPYLFNAKEFDEETGLYYYGARYYEPKTSMWISTDPLQEKYFNVSSYCYVLNNPLKLVDPDGKVVIASDQNAKRNIINTLSVEESKYVKFDDNGRLNYELLSEYKGSSENFMALKTLSESSTNYIFAVSNKDINGKQFYEKGTNLEHPENFSYGVTNLPGAEFDPSIDENVYIYTASFLDKRTQARNTAHEGYGHAYFYELSKKDSSINPNHTFGKVGTYKEYDPEFKMEIVTPIFGKNNTKLEQQIKTVEQQALKNYDEKNN